MICSLPLAALAENPPRLDTLVATRMVHGPQAEPGKLRPASACYIVPSRRKTAFTTARLHGHCQSSGRRLRNRYGGESHACVARALCHGASNHLVQILLTGGIPPAERRSLSHVGLIAAFGSKRVGENLRGLK